MEEEAQQHRAYSPTWLYFKHRTIKGNKTPLFERSNGFYIAWPSWFYQECVLGE